MRQDLARIGWLVLLLAVVAFWWWSPVLALYQIRQAARAGDADAFNARVDYPKLRENFKAQLSSTLTRKLAPGTGSSDIAKAGSAFGATLAMALVRTAVDALVRPETVMRAMQQGQLLPKKGESNAPAPSSESKPAVPNADDKVSWTSERQGVDKYVAYAKQNGDADDKRIAVVLERSGFVTGRLTEIRVPALAP
jgi:hypothetical protein